MISSDHFAVAEALAVDLASHHVDPNEAQKVVTYLRSKPDSRILFSYLRTIVENGAVVIRSRRSLTYYRDLLTACEHHLRPLQKDGSGLYETFAWSIRLLRYFRAVGSSELLYRKSANMRAETDPGMSSPLAGKDQSLQRQSVQQTLPNIDDWFTSKILELDDSAALIAIPGFSTDQAVGILPTSAFQGRRYSVGKLARVEVVNVRTLKSGRIVVDLRVSSK